MATPFIGHRSLRDAQRATSAAFTLMELLIVVAILGVVLTIAIPSIYRQLHPDSMQKAVDDVLKACEDARALAILNRSPMEIRIRPRDGTIQVAQASRQAASVESISVTGEAWRMDDLAKAAGGSEGSGGGKNFFARFSSHIMIKGIRLYVIDDYTEREETVVRFYPDGTSEEFSIVLQSDKDEWRMINLELVTGLPTVETDPNKFVHFR